MHCGSGIYRCSLFTSCAYVVAEEASNLLWYTDEQLAAIRQFVTNGGGLLAAGRNWVQQTTDANNILLDCGITTTIKASDRGVFPLPNPRYQPALFMLHNVSEITSHNQEASALTVEGIAFAVLWTKMVSVPLPQHLWVREISLRSATKHTWTG